MKIRSLLKRLWREEEGQDIIEYALLLALIGLAAATAFPPLAKTISGLFQSANSCLSTPGGGGVCTPTS